MDLALDLSVDELVLGVAGWSYGEGGLSPCQLAEFITYLIYNNYTFNGGKVKRQIMGMPMGMPAAPQIANLACYPVEREHSYVLGPGKSMTVCRHIDDFYASGVPLPPKEAYGMDYVVTASGASVVYLGVKVYVETTSTANIKILHTTVFDREFAYPYHIVRYPEFGSVVPSQQLGGVIMGRLVHCQETCSHMKDFKESVGSVFRNAMWRGYPRRLVQSVWSRFLFQRWHSVDIRVRELRVWFAKVWSFLARNGAQKVPNPLKPSLPLSAMEGSIAVLGVVTSSSNSGMDCDPLDSAVLVFMANVAVSSYLISSSCTSVVPLQQQQQQQFVSSHFSPTTLSEPFYGDCYGRNIVTSNCGSSSGYGSSSSSSSSSSSNDFGSSSVSSGCVVATVSSSPSQCDLGHQCVSFNGVSTEIYPVQEPTHGVVDTIRVF